MNEIPPVEYCNIDGQKLDPALIAKTIPKVKRTVTKKVGHFGWAVNGIPPGALDGRRVNAHKPFSTPEAAQQYKELAEKAGWLRVEVIELKKE